MRIKNLSPTMVGCTLFGLLFVHLRMLSASAQTPRANSVTNQPPEVAIVFPPTGVIESFATGTYVRIRASDSDGQVAAVHFYADGKLFRTVTNEPFTVFWPAVPANADFYYGTAVLTAVAVDNLGATNISDPVLVLTIQPPVHTVFIVTAPVNPLTTIFTNPPVVLPARANFTFSAQMLTSDGDDTPAYFFIGTNVVASVDPPYSITVTNWPEGLYTLKVGIRNPNGGTPIPESNSSIINIVPLLIQQPQLSTNGQFSFTAAGRVAGKATVIEASTNLTTWEPISTNLTSTNSFLFTDPQATNYSRRFYRAYFKE